MELSNVQYFSVFSSFIGSRVTVVGQFPDYTDIMVYKLVQVLKTVFTGSTNITEPDARTFLASFLGLAVQIREKLVNAEAFANAVRNGLPTENRILAEKLTEIMSETTNYSEDEVCLVIMKAVTKFATWMMGISPDYIQYFREQKIVDKLEATVETMVHLERYLVMTGGAEETGRYVTFQILVETVRDLVPPEQQH